MPRWVVAGHTCSLRRTRLRLTLAAIAAAACAREHPVNSTGPVDPPVAIVEPAEGDTVGGRVMIEASVTHRDAKVIRFLIDGVVVDSASVPPWRGFWVADAPVGGTEARITVALQDIDGGSVTAGPIAVWVRHDRPPGVTIAAPARAVWIERRTGAALTADANDPEEGPLPPERIIWSGSHLPRTLPGDHLPLDLLTEEEQFVTATATDRWGLAGTCTIRIRPFSYRPPATPEECLTNLFAAIRAADPDGFVGGCAECFRFVPCVMEAERSGWPLAWNRSLVATAVQNWFADPEVGWIEWDPGAVRLALWTAADTTWAWAECGPTSLSWSSTCAAGGTAGLLLARRAGEAWRVQSWHDRPGPGEVSLAAVLAGYGGLAPASPAGQVARAAARPPGAPRRSAPGG